MLSIFPELFDYSFYVPFILRVVLGLYFLYLGYRSAVLSPEAMLPGIVKSKRGFSLAMIIGVMEIVVGILLVIGFLTQPAALSVAIFSVIGVIVRSESPNSLPQSMEFLILLFFFAISIMFLGPGILAVDYPL